MQMRTLLFVPLLGFAFFSGVDSARAEETPKKEDDGYTQMAVFARALQLIRQDYVDDKKVNYDTLTHAALRGMLNSLDPHSQFMASEDFKEMQEDTSSRFGGLGIVVTMRDDRIIVVSPMEDTPGFKAGVLPGDQILKIDGQPIDKLDLNEAINKLRGNIGEKVELSIYRAATKEYKEFSIVRENIKVASVKDTKLLSSEQAGEFKIGYARITQFNEPTADELGAALDKLEKDGMQAFILDLRYNPGGLLGSAVNVAGQFLPPNTLVASTEGRAQSQTKPYRSSAVQRVRPKFPLAVLINGGSASGSEIVAGALKDLNRAILVGETTFGKGSVQSVIQLQDGSALRLTTAKYYTPGHQVIHEHGVAPTIRATLTLDQERLLMEQRRDDVQDEESKKRFANFHDTQLDRAVDALKGVMIYADRKTDAKKPATSTN